MCLQSEEITLLKACYHVYSFIIGNWLVSVTDIRCTELPPHWDVKAYKEGTIQVKLDPKLNKDEISKIESKFKKLFARASTVRCE